MLSIREKIENLLESTAREFECTIVNVSLRNHNEKKTLQIMLERIDGANVTIADCEKFSRAASVLLDVENPIRGHYFLEVSSTGIDRPLVKPKDFERFCGRYVVVKTYEPKNNRKIFKGLLETANEYDIKLKLDTPLDDGVFDIVLNYSEISYANLDGFRV